MSSQESEPDRAFIQLKSFDVVANEFPGSRYALSEEYNSKQQIGNNRFNVLIDMYVDDFDKHASEGNHEECDKIVDVIRNVTCRKKNQNDHGSCFDDSHRGRFLVKTTEKTYVPEEGRAKNHSILGWKELTDDASKALIRQTLEARMEEKTNPLYEPDVLLECIGFGVGRPEVKGVDGTMTSSPSRIRRSRSASNLMSDAQKALGGLTNSEEIKLQDDFEPIPICASLDFTDSNFSETVATALSQTQHNKNKRGRRRSLLRRSNSFESAFDRKKTFRNLYGVFSGSKRDPKDCNQKFHFNYDQISNSSVQFLSEGVVTNNDGIDPYRHWDRAQMGKTVSSIQGMDVVFELGCKSLSSKPFIIGNNRLSVLIGLQKERFVTLTPTEQQRNASDLLNMIERAWKGRLLMETNSSCYAILNHAEGIEALCELFLGETIPEKISSHQKPPESNSSAFTTRVFNSLLSAAPELPEFLRKASEEILSSGRSSLSENTSTKDRQIAAVEALKARNRSRQLLKEKKNGSAM